MPPPRTAAERPVRGSGGRRRTQRTRRELTRAEGFSTLPRLRRPPLLGAGARVALVAPAGPIDGAADLERAVANARSFGWDPHVAPHAADRSGYFAGTDAARLADLNRALADDAVDGVWCIRGGYGAMRLLPGIDYASLRRRPKALIGYSDITALHAAIGSRCELVSFHGPTGRAELTEFSRASLERAVVSDDDPFGVAGAAVSLVPGSARGRLVGGNLALLAALCGTPYAPDFDGAILVLEDVNEAVYRIDRMLVQLRLAGLLGRCAGIVFGQFTNYAEEEGTGGSRTLAEVLREAATEVGVPCIAGAPVGHVADQWTIPLGATAELDASARTLHLVG